MQQRFRLSRVPFWARATWRTALAAASAFGIVEARAFAGGSLDLPWSDWVPTIATAAASAYALFELAAAWAGWNRSTVTVEDGRITFATGYVSTATRSVWIAEVTGIDTARTLPGRVAGYGDVTVEARGMDAVTVRRMADVEAFVRLVRESKDAMADGATAIRDGR